MGNTEKHLETALFEGVVYCEECGGAIEPDAKSCACGWVNPLVALGLI